MTKRPNEPIDLSNGHPTGTTPSKGAEPNAQPPPDGEAQLIGFRELARRIHTELSAGRFEAALRTILLPLNKPRRDSTVQPEPPTNSPES